MYYNIHGYLIRSKLTDIKNKTPISRKYSNIELNNIEKFDILEQNDELHASGCNSYYNVDDCQHHGCNWNYYHQYCSE